MDKFHDELHYVSTEHSMYFWLPLKIRLNS